MKKIIVTLAAMLATSNSFAYSDKDNTAWSAHISGDEFTQSKYCYVSTKFYRGEDGYYNRTLLIPTDGKAINKNGELFELKYQFNVGAMGATTKNAKALIDGTPFNLDENMRDAVEHMKKSEQIKVRFAGAMDNESHTLNLKNFATAYSEAMKLCAD